MRLHLSALLPTIVFLIPQQLDTVAIILPPDSKAESISVSEAEAQFKQLCKDGTDDVRLKALAAALNPMPDWPQMVMNNDPSVCNRNPKPVIAVPLEKQVTNP